MLLKNFVIFVGMGTLSTAFQIVCGKRILLISISMHIIRVSLAEKREEYEFRGDYIRVGGGLLRMSK